MPSRSDTLRLQAIVLFLLIGGAASAEPNWVVVGREEDMGATIYVDPESIKLIEDQIFFAASLVSYDDVEFFEKRMETIGSIIELNGHDCENNLVFPFGSRLFSSTMPSKKTFVRKVDKEQIVGHTPGFYLTNTEGPVFDYVCSQ
jgi:hypothetical protein